MDEETDSQNKPKRRSQLFIGVDGSRQSRIFENGSIITERKVSDGEEVAGAIFDVKTNVYQAKNQQEISESTNSRGIDSYGYDPVGPDGFEEKAGVIVENGERIAGTILFRPDAA